MHRGIIDSYKEWEEKEMSKENAEWYRKQSIRDKKYKALGTKLKAYFKKHPDKCTVTISYTGDKYDIVGVMNTMGRDSIELNDIRKDYIINNYHSNKISIRDWEYEEIMNLNNELKYNLENIKI